MNKQELLNTLGEYVKTGIINTEEIAKAINATAVVQSGQPVQEKLDIKIDNKKSNITASNVLYVIGGLILLIGIFTLLFRFWSDLSSTIKIAITLGLSIACYISSITIGKDESLRKIKIILYVISAILLPIGIAITMSEDIPSTLKVILVLGTALFAYVMGIFLQSDEQSKRLGLVTQAIAGAILPVGIFMLIYEATNHATIEVGTVSLVATGLFIIYIVSLRLFNTKVFSFYSIAFGTWALYSWVFYLLTENKDLFSAVSVSDIFSYLTIAVGICYLLLSSYIKSTSHNELSRVLDFFGSIGFFTSILVLGGYKPEQSILWEFLGVLSLFFGLYYSNITQNKSILKITALFIFIFIGKITAEYFVDSLGWPVSLIVGGLVLIGVGFGLVKFGKKIEVQNT